MMPKKLNLTRIANHEMTRALRAVRGHIPKIEIVKMLIAQRAKAYMDSARALLIALMGILWVASEGSTGGLKVDVWSLALSIPVAYVNFAISLALLMGMVNLFSWYQLNEFTRIAVNRLFKFDNAAALSLFFEGSSAWSLGQSRQFRFFQPSKAHNSLGLPTMILVAAPFVVVILFVYMRAFLSILATLIRPIDAPFVTVLAVVSMMLLIYPFVWIVLQFVPFTFGKNHRFIRWNFLTPLHKRLGQWPPRAEAWLDEGRKR